MAGFDRKTMIERYKVLCKERDEAYAKAAPLEKELDAVNAEIAAKQAKALELAAKIEAAWGPAHIDRKKEIAGIARFIGRFSEDELKYLAEK